MFAIRCVVNVKNPIHVNERSDLELAQQHIQTFEVVVHHDQTLEFKIWLNFSNRPLVWLQWVNLGWGSAGKPGKPGMGDGYVWRLTWPGPPSKSVGHYFRWSDV